MDWLSRNLLWFFTITWLIQLSSVYAGSGSYDYAPKGTHRPEIKSKKKVQILEANEMYYFELECYGYAPLNWHFSSFAPGELGYDTNIKQRYHWDSHQMDNSEGHHSTLWFLDPDYLDTGYFTCYYGDYNSTYDASAPNDHVYIFFSNPSHPIVYPNEMEPSQRYKIATELTHTVVPFRTSHPDVELTLLRDEEQVYPARGSHWIYDCREGFISSTLMAEDTGLYTVKTVESDRAMNASINFYLFVLSKSGHLVTPFLDDSRATNVISGDTFQLNCSVVYPAGSQIDLEYVFPHSPGVEHARRYRIGDMVVSPALEGGLDQMAYRTLTVNDAKITDGGSYMCRSTVHLKGEDPNWLHNVTVGSRNSSVSIRVHEEHDGYVEMPGPKSTTMELEIGESVVLRADFKAHPKAVVTWLKDGLPLGNVTKYNVASSEIMSVLHISNLQVTDTATYTVEVAAGKITTARKFLLVVAGEPLLETDMVGDFIDFGDEFTISCLTSFCESLIYFRQCSSELDCVNEWVSINSPGLNMEQVRFTHEKRLNRVQMKGQALVSGEYKCTSLCDSLSTTKKMLISGDMVKVYRTTGDIVVEKGNDFLLSCYTTGISQPRATWFKDGVEVVDGVVSNSKYGSSLLIQSADMDRSGIYSCQFSNSVGQTMKVSVILHRFIILWIFLGVFLPILSVLGAVYCQKYLSKKSYSWRLFHGLSFSNLLWKPSNDRQSLVTGEELLDLSTSSKLDLRREPSHAEVNSLQKYLEMDQMLNSHLDCPLPRRHGWNGEMFLTSTNRTGELNDRPSNEYVFNSNLLPLKPPRNRNHLVDELYNTERNYMSKFVPAAANRSSEMSDYMLMSFTPTSQCPLSAESTRANKSVKSSTSYEDNQSETYYEWDETSPDKL